VNADVALWCTAVADYFREHEHRLTGDLRRDRDSVLVEYALRALADPDVEGSRTVLEEIDRARAVAVTR
jgi:hypothetical protein